MPTSSSYRILQEYVDYLNGLFNQLITDSRLIVWEHPKQQGFYYITCFQDGFRPLILQPKWYLYFSQLVYIQASKVRVEDYVYRFSYSSNPDNKEEWVFRYEYSCNPPQNIPHAHFHINANRGKEELEHIHFPTGRVSIEQIIHHLIVEYGIQPRRRDWFECLAKSHQGFVKRRTDIKSSQFP